MPFQLAPPLPPGETGDIADGSRSSTMRFDRNAEVEQLFENARRLLSAGDHTGAVAVLQQALDAQIEGHALVGETFGHPWYLALQLLRGVAAGPGELIERLSGARAASQLERAWLASDQRDLERITIQYRYTSAGREALRRLASGAFDDGDYLSASAWFARLFEEEPDPMYAASRDPVNVVRWMMSEHLQGNTAALSRIWNRYEAVVAHQSVGINGQQVTVRGWLDAQRLLTAVDPVPGQVNVTLPELIPTGEALWSYQLESAEDYRHESFETLQQLAHYGMAGIYRAQAQVVGERLLLHSRDGLTCLDLNTGDALWTHAADAPFEDGGDENRALTATRRSLGGGLFDRFTSDGRYVYFVEETDALHNSEQGLIVRRNRLVACDIETGEVVWERRDIRPSDDQRSQVVCQYFLSSPVVDGSKLYVLGQESFQNPDAAVRLVMLDSHTGTLLSMTHVGFSPSPLIEDSHRQEFAGQIALQGELVVCVTGCGCVAGVDPSAGVTRWAHVFPRLNLSAPPQMEMYYYGVTQSSIGWEWWRGWRGVTLATAGEYTVFASPEADRLIVYDYRSGQPVWEQAREFGRFVAAVLHDRVLVAGSQGLAAFDLATGAQLWSAQTPPIVGEGFAAGHVYVAPLSNDRCAAIDVMTGEVLHQSRFESSVFSPAVVGSVDVHYPATLIRDRGALLRITPEGVTRQQSLQTFSESFAIGDTPADAELLRQALLFEDLGAWDAADELLTSLASADSDIAAQAEEERVALLMRRLARGFELTAAQDAFLRQSQFGSEYLALLLDHRLELLRQPADEEGAAPAVLSAAEATSILNDLFVLQADAPERVFFNPADQRRVRLDRYLQGAILDVLASVEESARPEIEHLAASRVQQSFEDAASLRHRWHAIFRNDRLPWAQLAAVETSSLDGLISSERLLCEMLWWELSESPEPLLAAQATLRLAELPASRVDGIPALLLERIEPHLDLQLADGTTVREAIQSAGDATIWPVALAARDQVRWPAAVPEVTPGRRRAGTMAQRTVRIEPTFPQPLARINVEAVPDTGSPESIRFSGTADSFWSADLPGELAGLNHGYFDYFFGSYEPTEKLRAWSVGPLVYLQSGAELVAYRPFNDAGEPEATSAWPRQLHIRSVGSAAIQNTETTLAQRIGIRDRGSEYSDSFGYRVDQFGPFLHNFFCMPETGDLVVRSSSSGRELWRRPVVAGNRWIADRETVVVYDEHDWVFHAYRAIDGELQATHRLPGRVIDTLATAGSILLLEFAPDDQQSAVMNQLAAWHAGEGRIIWSKPLDAVSLPFVVDQQLFGLMQRDTEQIELLDIATGDVVCRHLPAQPDDVQNIRVIVDADQVIVVVSRVDVQDNEAVAWGIVNPNPRIIGMNGTLHAFDRARGEWIWSRHLKDVDLNLDQPRHIPLLVLSDNMATPAYDPFFGEMAPVESKCRFLVLDRRTGESLVDEYLDVGVTRNNTEVQKTTFAPLTVLTTVDLDDQTILLRTNTNQSFLFDFTAEAGDQ